jgi:membrane-associated phospholipid phosphatase
VKLKINIGSVPVRILMAILLFIISIVFFALIAHEIVLENEDSFDSAAFTIFNARSSPFLVTVFHWLTFFGSTYFLIPSYVIIIIILVYKKRRSDAIDVAIVSITSTLLMVVLKEMFARTRPELPLFRELHNYSFPSGHALSSFIFLSLLASEVWKSRLEKKWRVLIVIFFYTLSIFIGISRIVLRYHYASDVLAGFSLGIAYVLLFFWLQKRFRKKTISVPVNKETLAGHEEIFNDPTLPGNRKAR